MPALVAFNRRWHIGSDDLFFPAAIGLIIRFFWLFLVSMIYGFKNEEIIKCEAWQELEVFFIGVIVITSLVIINEIAIFYVSMKGTVMHSRPRRHMSKLLYIQLALYIPELLWAILGTYWTVAHFSLQCKVTLIIAVCVSVALQWTMLLIVFIGTFVLFDPFGKQQIEYDQESSKEMWERRCRSLCCCLVGRDDQYLSAVSDISELLSSWFPEADVVPSDVAVGLMLLRQEQEQKHSEERSQPGEMRQKGIPVNLSEPKEKAIVEDAYYFSKFALGSYGWPLYVFMNPCSGPWNLCGKIRCCVCCAPSLAHIHSDNCCEGNTAGVKLQTCLEDDDLVYCSYQDKIYEVPFYVAVDHKSQSVVVSIRGSLSWQDAMTDLTAQQQDFDIEGAGTCYAHKGMLRCAHYVKSVLEKREILQSAFSRAGEGYSLVIVGHSLGAGTASLLSVLLKPIYPDLKCFAYSNPSVLSTHATPYCEDFIVSVVLGKDVVPRMTGTSASVLRDDLASVIRRCSLPKYRVLMSGCWQALCFCLGPRPHNSQGDSRSFFSGSRQYRSALNRHSWENNLTQPLLRYTEGEAAGLTSACDSNESSLRYIAEGDLDPVTTSCSPVSVEKLYPAGRILQLDERISNRIEAPRFDVMWSDKDNYSKIIIHPDMLGDHFPDRVMRALGRVAASVQEDALLQEV